MFAILPAMVLLSAYPSDDVDHFLKVSKGLPGMALILDATRSMGTTKIDTPCDWYYANKRSGSSTYNVNYSSTTTNWPLNKWDAVKATLIGCEDSTDGLFDSFNGKMLFSVYKFNLNPVYLSKCCTSNAATLKAINFGGVDAWTNTIKAYATTFDDFEDYFSSCSKTLNSK